MKKDPSNFDLLSGFNNAVNDVNSSPAPPNSANPESAPSNLFDPFGISNGSVPNNDLFGQLTAAPQAQQQPMGTMNSSAVPPAGSPMMGPRIIGGPNSPVNAVGGGFTRPPPPQQPNKPSDPFADLGNLAGMGGWVGSKPTTPMGGTPAGGTPFGGSTPVMGSPQHRPQTAAAWQGQPPGSSSSGGGCFLTPLGQPSVCLPTVLLDPSSAEQGPSQALHSDSASEIADLKATLHRMKSKMAALKEEEQMGGSRQGLWCSVKDPTRPMSKNALAFFVRNVITDVHKICTDDSFRLLRVRAHEHGRTPGGNWQQQQQHQQQQQQPQQQQQQQQPPKTPVGTPHHQMKSPSQPNYGRVNFDVGKFLTHNGQIAPRE
ncbi:probable global transcription activator SNF2L2 [Macrobrachium nipponense]|uniref:probable global transcription activator SNF2L2 n=1 Tax=Macrobrachium nipponense TaxID=159736 RepID=UPI0030C8B4FE